jgi:hypothetical protein
MIVIRFFHQEEVLEVLNNKGEIQKKYQATCKVRNEINGRRRLDQIVKTFPITSKLGRQPYNPRKFPTGTWRVKMPIPSDDPEFAPVKIPTDAIRRVLTSEVEGGRYAGLSGKHQDDAFYHLHYSHKYRTTLGCIRLNSADDALEIAAMVTKELKDKREVWLEVMVHRGE